MAKTPVPPSALAGVPDPVSGIVMRLLAKDPDERYQSVAAIRYDLETCARHWSLHGEIEPFDLGRHDVPMRLVVPRKLYGRDRELAALTAAFDAACEGRPALVLVGGYAGVGKTSLPTSPATTCSLASSRRRW